VEGTFFLGWGDRRTRWGCVDEGVLTDAFVQKNRECISKHFNPIYLVITGVVLKFA
jgi:hypothetical protein